jgi:hypothetical protein
MLKYKHNTFKRKIKVYTKAFYKNKWYVKRNKLLDENGKLRTYLKLKCNFGFENYLHILSDFNQRKSFTKFRISNHKLKIETGRFFFAYKLPKNCRKRLHLLFYNSDFKWGESTHFPGRNDPVRPVPYAYGYG